MAEYADILEPGIVDRNKPLRRQLRNALPCLDEAMISNLLLCLVIAAPPSAQPVPKSLVALEARAKAWGEAWSPEIERQKEALACALVEILDRDDLRTGEALRRAAMVTPNLWMDLPVQRQRYELLLTATAMGDGEAPGRLADAWSNFLMATGRRPHLPFGEVPPIAGEAFMPEPTAKAVRRVLLDPRGARTAAKGLAPNRDLQRLVEADQDLRNRIGSRSIQSTADMEAGARADWERRKVLRQMLDRMDLMTAEDFSNASLLMQHGTWFGDYALAHELAICALLMEPRLGRGLAAVTYDRMLQSMGYPQRIGTQYGSTGRLAPMEPKGFSDTMRQALGRCALSRIPKQVPN